MDKETIICSCHDKSIRCIFEFLTEHNIETFEDLMESDCGIGNRCEQCIDGGMDNTPSVQDIIEKYKEK